MTHPVILSAVEESLTVILSAVEESHTVILSAVEESLTVILSVVEESHHHCAAKSNHFGFIDAIKPFFFALVQPFICFSRAIAAVISFVVSK